MSWRYKMKTPKPVRGDNTCQYLCDDKFSCREKESIKSKIFVPEPKTYQSSCRFSILLFYAISATTGIFIFFSKSLGVRNPFCERKMSTRSRRKICEHAIGWPAKALSTCISFRSPLSIAAREQYCSIKEESSTNFGQYM